MSKKPLQRWDFNYGGHMERDEAGEYVEYYDYAELAVAKQEIERQKRYDVNSQRLLMAAADNLVREIERNECHHEDTKRGGAQWTICLQCDSS